MKVRVLGLWDTVEALGVPDYGSRWRHRNGIKPKFVDIDVPNPLYGDQLCNVELAYHALSIDDNREWIFTPLPLTRKHLFASCPGGAGAKVREVWFSGAHSDVGGGYSGSLLSGVSLNWMLNNLRGEGILPPDARVAEDRYGSSHNPDTFFYREVSRNIASYVMSEVDAQNGPMPEFADSMCVHESVFDRRLTVPLKAHENHALALRQAGEICVAPDPKGFANPKRWLQTRPVGETCQDGERRIMVKKYPECWKSQ